MNREQALDWKRRMERLNAFERDELRRTPPEVKLRQIASLMRSVDAFGWYEALAQDDWAVRAIWKTLRDLHGARR